MSRTTPQNGRYNPTPAQQPEPEIPENLGFEIEPADRGFLVRFLHGTTQVHTEKFDPFDARAAESALMGYCFATGLEPTTIRLRQELRNRIIDLVETKRSGSEIVAYTVSELANLDLEVTYLVDGVVSKGKPMIVAGKSKTLKSTLAIDLAVALSTGKPFLNQYRVSEAQDVLFVSSEAGLATIRDKIRANLESRWMEMSDASRLHVTGDLVTIETLPARDRIKRAIERTGATVLIIDPTYLALPGDNISNVFQQGRVLLEFSKACEEWGVTLILVHHAKKTIQHFNPLELEDMAGAGFGEFARQWMLINRRELPEPGSGLFKLWLTWAGSDGHSGGHGLDIDEGNWQPQPGWRKWEIELRSMSECLQERRSAGEQRKAEREAKAIADAKETIRADLESGTQPKSKLIGSSNPRTRAFEEMLASDTIVETKVTMSNGQTYNHYKLADE